MSSQPLERADKPMLGVSVVVTATMLALLVRTRLTARDIVTLALALAPLAYFSRYHVPLPVQFKPERFGVSHFGFTFTAYLTVPLAMVTPLAPAASLAAMLQGLSKYRTPGARRPWRFHWFISSLDAGCILVACSTARYVDEIIQQPTVGAISAVVVGVMSYEILEVGTSSVYLWAERGVFLSFSELTSPVILVAMAIPLAAAILLCFRAHLLLATGILVVVPGPFIELARRLHAVRVQVDQQTQERLRLLGRMMETEERERRRLAGDLHDGPIQAVLAVRLLLENAEADIRTGSVDRGYGQMRFIRERLLETAKELRHLMIGLAPQPLTDQGLIAAIENDRMLLSPRFENGITIHCDLARQLDPSTEALVYRIVHEALVNASKHSEAGLVHVSVVDLDGTIHVEVVDDGRGIEEGEQAEALLRGHVGLATMRERVSLTGGTLTISKRLSGGTSVTASLPTTLDNARE